MGPPLLILAVAFLVILQFTIPKRYAFVPILVACFHLGDMEVLPQLTPVRIIILCGLARITFSGTLTLKPQSALDKTFYVFSVVALLVSMAPRLDIPSPLNQNLGLILNVHGTYLYGRNLLNGEDIIQRFAKALVIISLPLALFVTLEQRSGRNYYKPLGARSEYSMARLDKNRALGPFQHAILSGTAGAVVIPFGLLLWRRNKKLSLLGMASGGAIVIASASSGPVAASIATGACICVWPFRRKLTLIQRVGLAAAIVAHFVSSRGIWYLMARIDLVGGSTGYHRARLIDSAIGDLHRWWFVGTDFTRTWMFSGVSWSPRHTDITNYYIQFGVTGGLGLMLSFIAALFLAYKYCGERIRATNFEASETNFSIWCVGAALTANTISFFSIAYFDQSFVNVFMIVALAPAIAAIPIKTVDKAVRGPSSPNPTVTSTDHQPNQATATFQ